MVVDWLFRRPVAVISAAFVFGAAAEAVIPEHAPAVPLTVALTVACVIVSSFAAPQRLLWLSLASFALGIGLTRSRLPPLSSPLTAPFEGTIASAPLPIRYGYRLLLCMPDGGAFVQVTVPSDEMPRWRIGDRVRVHRFWGRPTQRRRYRFQHILWAGRTDAEALERLDKSDAFVWAERRERWRQFVFARWQQSLPTFERTATLSSLASIVFGMRTVAVSDADERAFARSGLAHLFVPSGSQVTLLMGIAWLAHRFLGLPPFPLLAVLLGFYLPLTRSEPSIARAVLMGLYVFAGWHWWRDVDWHTALWLSSAVLVAFEPSMLGDVGFQLSYAATFGLLYASPIALRLLSWLPDWLRFPVAATLSAQLFLTPVLVYYFGRISVIAPLANLCAFIPASLALTLGFVSALLASVTPLAAMPVSFVAGELAKFIVRLAYWFSAPSWASIKVAPLSGWQTLLVLGLLTALVAWLKRSVNETASEFR